MRLNAIN